MLRHAKLPQAAYAASGGYNCMEVWYHLELDYHAWLEWVPYYLNESRFPFFSKML